MKDEEYISLICKEFCSFYKEGKEDLCCGAFLFLKKNVTPRELRYILEMSKKSDPCAECNFSADAEIKRLVCEKCDFLVDGCDFRENGSQPPCGGYHIIETILLPF